MRNILSQVSKGSLIYIILLTNIHPVFDCGFAEATDKYTLAVGKESDEVADISTADSYSDIITSGRHFEDSDTEDEETFAETDMNLDSHATYHAPGNLPSPEGQARNDNSTTTPRLSTIQGSNESVEMLPSENESSAPVEETDEREDFMPVDSESTIHDPSDHRSVSPEKTSEKSSPQIIPIVLNSESVLPQTTELELPGPKKVKVVVKDIAYATYRAVLYYVSFVDFSFGDELLNSCSCIPIQSFSHLCLLRSLEHLLARAAGLRSPMLLRGRPLVMVWESVDVLLNREVIHQRREELGSKSGKVIILIGYLLAPQKPSTDSLIVRVQFIFAQLSHT